MKKLNKYYEKYYKKITKKATNYALDKFVNSDYAKTSANTVPMLISATILRGIIYFLITSRLKTDIFLFDFCFGVCVTIVLTVLTPFFYNIIKYQENEYLYITNLILDNLFGDNGWDFFYKWKTRILGGTAIFLIFILFFVEIDSAYIQESIFHSLISGFIVDLINTKIEALVKKKDNAPKDIKNVAKKEIKKEKPIVGKFIDNSYIVEDNHEFDGEIEMGSTFVIINEYDPDKSKKD